jgi:hypothetical protein
LRFEIARNGHLKCQDGFQPDFRLVRNFVRLLIIGSQVKAIGLPVLELLIEISQRNANTDRLVDIKVVKVSVRNLEVAAGSQAVINRIDDA